MFEQKYDVRKFPKYRLRDAFILAFVLYAVLPNNLRAEVPAPIEIGVLPNISARILLAQYEPMRKYLETTLARKVQISTAPSWRAFHERTVEHHYDLIITAAHLGRLAQVDGEYQLLLSYQPYIKGMILFALDRPIDDISALKGQTLVLSNAQSLITFRGMQWLGERGLYRGLNFKTINTPTDDSVGTVVVRGDAIAAMLSGGEYRAIPDAIKAKTRILTTFAEVPGFVIMASPKYNAEEAQRFKNILLKFAASRDEGQAFFAATGFTSIVEPAAGLMESMDIYLSATRESLAERK